MKIEMQFCTLEFFENYVVSVINEGIVFTLIERDEITKLCNNHYGQQSYVYITNRINSYSIDPTIYKVSSELDNLAGIAVVALKKRSINSAIFEKYFLKKPFAIFSTLNEAKQWSENIITLASIDDY